MFSAIIAAAVVFARLVLLRRRQAFRNGDRPGDAQVPAALTTERRSPARRAR